MSEIAEANSDAEGFYDAGDQGCSSNVMGDIRQCVLKLHPGQRLEVRSTEATIAVDLPAWCRLTGNELVSQQQTGDGATYFLIERKP